MKCWHISDTHMNHDQLVVPLDIDIVVPPLGLTWLR